MVLLFFSRLNHWVFLLSLLTCVNYSSINVGYNTLSPIERNKVFKWDASVSNAAKHLREMTFKKQFS